MGVKITNPGVIKKYAKAARRIKDVRQLNRDIAIKLHQNVIVRFVKERDPDGQSWKPSKRAQREGGQTLTDTGRLRASIRFGFGRNYAEVFTNTLEYAAVHNEGAARMPKRQYIGYGSDERNAVNDAANQFIKKAFG